MVLARTKTPLFCEKVFDFFPPQFPVSNVTSLYFTCACPAFKIKLAVILAFALLYSTVVHLMVSDVPERANVVLLYYAVLQCVCELKLHIISR